MAYHTIFNFQFPISGWDLNKQTKQKLLTREDGSLHMFGKISIFFKEKKQNIFFRFFTYQNIKQVYILSESRETVQWLVHATLF